MKHLLLLAAAAVAGTAHAHVTLDQPAALAGSYYKATLRINHGCAGQATTLVRVFVPEAMRGARPLPKAGWTLEAPKAPLPQPYQSHGQRITEDVREITWRGGSLPDAWADEFSFVAQLPAAPGPLPIKVLQQCGEGKLEWFELPAAGGAAPRSPAPVLDVLPGDGSGHHH
jgi:uncharacterized protein YcnI